MKLARVVLIFFFVTFFASQSASQIKSNHGYTPSSLPDVRDSHMSDLYFNQGWDKMNRNIKGLSVLQFGVGFMNGFSDSYLFRFNDRHKALGLQPNHIAWKNKWKLDSEGNVTDQERFWGSSRWFVGFTDPFHFAKWAQNRGNELTGMLYIHGEIERVKNRKKKKWYWYVADFAVLSAVKSAGFQLSYNVVFKK